MKEKQIFKGNILSPRPTWMCTDLPSLQFYKNLNQRTQTHKPVMKNFQEVPHVI